jgi:hypothetical protein
MLLASINTEDTLWLNTERCDSSIHRKEGKLKRQKLSKTISDKKNKSQPRGLGD